MPDRVYMPHAAHFIGGRSCAFHIATYVPTGYIISTVGEYRPSIFFDGGNEERHTRTRRDEDPCEELGYSADPKRPALYETMVFKAHAVELSPCCCPWQALNGSEQDSERYSTANDAMKGHETFCRKWEHHT